MHPNVQWSTIYNDQDMEATQMSTDRGMNKENVVHIYNIILSNHKKESNNAISSNMDGPTDYYIKVKLSQRQMPHDITPMWNIIFFKKWYKWTYSKNRNRLTDIGNKLMGIKGDEHSHTTMYKIR